MRLFLVCRVLAKLRDRLAARQSFAASPHSNSHKAPAVRDALNTFPSSCVVIHAAQVLVYSHRVAVMAYLLLMRRSPGMCVEASQTPAMLSHKWFTYVFLVYMHEYERRFGAGDAQLILRLRTFPYKN
ncbi:hypothetical protein E2C01_020398 [Portunus trituberculatus]|uniref:Uncharacterized protein n=1 Tax=Portunus trituberculatus TaxID=210409 RepID=A0A5B7DZS2_PORTR|nr:hypothetical protein [Portunus trituberculatus]